MFWLRINGRGNAWPIQLGKSHPMYQEDGINECANASYAICSTQSAEYHPSKIEWEIWVDAGQGTPSAILDHHNRIPEAIILTHPHFDHVMGVDYIVQCYFRQYHKRYPIYASEACIKAFQLVFFHLKDFIQWRILPVAEPFAIDEANGLKVSAFPVYHGLSAKGASMLLFQFKNIKSKLLITGDLLFPLISAAYLNYFADIKLMLVDTNNRFPSPKTNHWSLINNDSIIFKEFIQSFSFNDIRQAHEQSKEALKYVNDYLNEIEVTRNLINNILDFVKIIAPSSVSLIHYSGAQDLEYYGEPILNTIELNQWVQQFNEVTKFTVPKKGQLLPLFC